MHGGVKPPICKHDVVRFNNVQADAGCLNRREEDRAARVLLELREDLSPLRRVDVAVVAVRGDALDVVRRQRFEQVERGLGA